MGAILFLLYGSLLTSIVGAQLITLTSDPDTNGSYCPGRVTFTCNGTNVVNGLQWQLNGITNISFFLMHDDTNFPRIISERNNITISINTARLVADSPGFINLVSVLTVQSLDPILDNTVSCQFFKHPRSSFVVHVRDFVDPGKITFVRVLSGNEEELMISWTLSDSQCEGSEYNFRVILKYSTNTVNKTVPCCAARFPVVPNVNQYEAYVWALNSQGEAVGTPSSMNISTDRTSKNSSSHTLEHSACEATFMCISAAVGECVFEIMRNDMIEQRQRGAANSSVTFPNLMPNTLYFYHINLTSLQPILIIENQSFTTDEGSCGSSSTAVAGVVPIVVLVPVLAIIVAIFFIIWHVKHKKKMTGPRAEWSEAKAVMELHSVKEEGMQVDDKGISGAESNVVQGHKRIQQGTTDCLLEEKEKLTKAITQTTQEPQQQLLNQQPQPQPTQQPQPQPTQQPQPQPNQQPQPQPNQQPQQQEQEKNPIYTDLTQVGNKKDITKKTKPTVPLPAGMYSHLNTVHPTGDEYSSLVHDTTGAQGQSSPAVFIPRGENYEPFDPSGNKNNGSETVGSQRNKQGNGKHNKKANQHK